MIVLFSRFDRVFFMRREREAEEPEGLFSFEPFLTQWEVSRRAVPAFGETSQTVGLSEVGGFEN